MGKVLNLEYGAIHATYWMAYAVLASFASAYLLDRGYSNSEIGIILAVGAVLSVILQPFVADLCDRTKKISIIGITEIITVGIFVFMFLTLVMRRASIALSVVFVLMYAWHTTLQPLFNSLAFKLSESGHEVKFGMMRAVGSLGYSVLCAFLGTLVEKIGIQVLPITGLTSLVFLMLAIYLAFNTFKKACEKNGVTEAQLLRTDKVEEVTASDCEVEDINLVEFIKRNKLFILAQVGVLGIFFSNAILNNFMYQVVDNIGGDSGDMGRILSVMAFLEIPPMLLFETFHKKFSCKSMLIFGAICFTIKIVIVYFSTSVTMLYIAQLFQLGSFGIFLPAMVCFIDEIMERGEAVKGQAFYTIMVTISSVFASLIGGVLIDLYGVSKMLLVASIATGAGAVVFSMLVGGIKGHKNE